MNKSLLLKCSDLRHFFLTLLFLFSGHFDPVEVLTLFVNTCILNRILPALMSFHQESIFSRKKFT